MHEITTLIIATNERQGRAVRDAIVRNGGQSMYGPEKSCPMIPRLQREEIGWVSAESALESLYGWTPRRIVLVDYPRWTSPKVRMVALWHWITVNKHKGAEVVWW